MVMEPPVWGLRPARDARFLTLKVPKPVITTLSPFIIASRILPKTALTADSAVRLVRPTFLETRSTNSFFVISSANFARMRYWNNLDLLFANDAKYKLNISHG